MNYVLYLDKILSSKDKKQIIDTINKELDSINDSIYVITDVESDNYEVLLQKHKINSCKKVEKIPDVTIFKERKKNLQVIQKRIGGTHTIVFDEGTLKRRKEGKVTYDEWLKRDLTAFRNQVVDEAINNNPPKPWHKNVFKEPKHYYETQPQSSGTAGVPGITGVTGKSGTTGANKTTFVFKESNAKWYEK
jgi:hypothetical protein